MRVLQLKIENFRGFKNADLTFDLHTLLVGRNNVCNSTGCDALDLVLCPDQKGRNQPSADVRGSLRLPNSNTTDWDVENIAIKERLSLDPIILLAWKAGSMGRYIA